MPMQISMGDKFIDKQWVDIIPPTAPVDNTPLIWLAGLVLLTLLAVLAYWHWRSRSKQQALRALRTLQKNIRRQTDTKRALFLLTEQLRRGFVVPRLDAVMMAGDKKQKWMQFRNSLQHACYCKGAPDHEMLKTFCNSGIDWLKQSPTQTDRSGDANV